MTLITQCVTWAMLVFVIASLVETKISPMRRFSRSNRDFANALYSKLAKKGASSNILFSPLSIHVILALAYVGAKGKTAEQMQAGLHLPAKLKDVETGVKRLLQGMANNSKSTTLEIANKIYVAKKFHIKDEFFKVATKNFLSEVDAVDLSLGEETAKVINAWVEKKTHAKIKNIVSKDDLGPAIKSVLINAVYFKGLWNSFNKNKTKSKEFFVTAKKTKNVEFMRNKSINCGFVKDNEIGADILELNYKDNTASLVVILPFKVDGLTDVENKLQSTNLKNIFDSIKVQEVNVTIPKFKLEETISLKEHLMALEMTEMFQGSADFSGFSDARLSVSKVLHKAFIEVNEKGTEAAAATAVTITLMSAMVKPPVFLANHPFVFLVRSKITGAILFMGRFAEPK